MLQRGVDVFGGLSSNVEAITVGISAVDAPRVMVDMTSDAETPSSTDSEVASRVGVAGALGASSSLSLALVKIVGVCAVECACIKAMGEIFEPWVMRGDAVLCLAGTLRGNPAPRRYLVLNVEGPVPLSLPCRKRSRDPSACMSSSGLAPVMW